MHADNLKNAVNCDKLHDCLETLMMNRTISCYARRLHVTYRCTSRQNMADNSLNSDITTPLYDYSTPTIMTNTENPISDVGEGLKRCDIICHVIQNAAVNNPICFRLNCVGSCRGIPPLVSASRRSHTSVMSQETSRVRSTHTLLNLKQSYVFTVLALANAPGAFSWQT